MDQPWWVYAIIATACLVAFLATKVIENKFMKADDDLDFAGFVIGCLGILAAIKAAVELNIL